MKRLVIIGLMCCLAGIGMVANSWAADEDKPKTPEQKAWEEGDSLNKQSLQDFLKQFPDGNLAQQAKVALELQDKVASISGGKSKGGFTISFIVLGERWKGWQKRKPEKGFTGYFRSGNSLGFFTPTPLSGGKTIGGGSISFDDKGDIHVSPTGNGSIIAFKTGGMKFSFINGIIIETPSDEPIFFAVIEGRGLVHLKGIGKVTLPSGKTTDLK